MKLNNNNKELKTITRIWHGNSEDFKEPCFLDSALSPLSVLSTPDDTELTVLGMVGFIQMAHKCLEVRVVLLAVIARIATPLVDFWKRTGPPFNIKCNCTRREIQMISLNFWMDNSKQ